MAWRAPQGARIGSNDSYESTVELYRSGRSTFEREPLPYDLTDPLDLGVWVGLLVYLDAFRGVAGYEPTYGAEPTPFELEQDLNALASHARAALGSPVFERLGARDGQATALAVLSALFPSHSPGARHTGDDGKPSEPEASTPLACGAPRVPLELWRLSSEYLRHLEEVPSEGADETAERETQDGDENPAGAASGKEQADPTDVKDPKDIAESETAARYEELRRELLARPLATVVYMARIALGGTLTQSEAARRLGLSPARVKVLVDAGRYRHLRAGRTVLLLEDEVSLAAHHRRA